MQTATTPQAETKFWLKSYPSEIPATIDFQAITLPQYLQKSAEKYQNHPALIFQGKPISYTELNNFVHQFGRALQNLGVQKGDKVAIMLPNFPQLVVANFATQRLGATSVMVNPLYTERELAYQLNDSDAETLVVWDVLYPKVATVWQNTPLKRVIVCHLNDFLPIPAAALPPGMYAEAVAHPQVFEFKNIMESADNQPIEDKSEWNGLATLLYTGGTTGVSKGVMLNHSNLSINIQQTIAWNGKEIEYGSGRVLAIYPFFHAAGYTALQNLPLACGYTVYLIPRPEAKSLAEIIATFKPTALSMVPSMFVGLLQEEKFLNTDLSFVKSVASGASPMPPAAFAKLKAMMPQARFADVYGLTEISPIGTGAPIDRPFRAGSVGLPTVSTEIKIMDLETGETEMPNGQSGEICFRGPQVMQGYYKKPQQTAEVIRNGWFYTGDIGYMDEDGWLYIVDRKKDMIISGGYNVYPKEIDEILTSHPKVLEACTIGVPDEYRGETAKAFLVLKPNESLSEDEIKAYCKSKLAAFKVPTIYEFTEALPKSAVGKILRRELRQMELAKLT
ncbi:MAG: long-chain fatty acid--CoA ligase [Microscillaceae bacterium]|jgi:long-chain acyl-CoA synthetase|nr:long-chain fatty acid--CoA ligase [Microscillaceae bacterium]